MPRRGRRRGNNSTARGQESTSTSQTDDLVHCLGGLELDAHLGPTCPHGRDPLQSAGREEEHIPLLHTELSWDEDPAFQAALDQYGYVVIEENVNIGEDEVTGPTPWIYDINFWMQPRRRTFEYVNDEIDAFDDFIRPKPYEVAIRQDVLTCFERVVAKLWPTAKVHVFGSYTTGLYLPDGDFDIVLQDTRFISVATTAMLHELRDALVHAEFADQSKTQVIAGARVPLLKFTTVDRFGGCLRFDVSLDASSPHSNKKLNGPEGAIKARAMLDQLGPSGSLRRNRVETLVYLVKVMLEHYNLHEVKHGGLSGFSVLCMVVWYFQTQDRTLDESMADTLVAFMRTFTWPRIDFSYYAISAAHHGGILGKRALGWYNAARPWALAIQHPVDLDRDLASGSHRWADVVSVFEDNLNNLELWRHSHEREHEGSLLDQIGIAVDPKLVKCRDRRAKLNSTGIVRDLAATWIPEIRKISRYPDSIPTKGVPQPAGQGRQARRRARRRAAKQPLTTSKP